MKISESLLYENEFGGRIFNNSVEKAKKLLSNVFDLNFNELDPKIIKINDCSENYRYEVIFNINGREITAIFNFESENLENEDRIVREVLRINELENCDIKINQDKDFKVSISEIIDSFEEKYDIIFTLLDPDEKNENIKEFKYDEKNKIFKLSFTTDYHEALFNIEYIESDKVVKVNKYNHHVIYLE